jgi:outer membrane lipoprotein-sorting protein
MSSRSFSRSPLRWAAPVAAVVLLAGAGPLVTSLTANAHGTLPARTAAQLLVDVKHARVDGLSGTIVQTADLGFPDLPSLGGRGGSASFSSLVSGSHTMRLWYAGPDHVRLALLGQLGESDLVRNGSDVWAWSSSDNTATHYTVSTGDDSATSTPLTGAVTSTGTPQQAAEAALEAIDPTTKVTTERVATVAGRDAYQLVLQPRDPRSLVGSIQIAIDGATHIPTRVQVFARGAASPAFETGFTSFTTSPPDASVFGFTPPPGATVKQGDAPEASEHRMGRAHAGRTDPRIVGKGWTSVAILPVAARSSAQGGGLAAVLKTLPTVSGSWGSGHLLRTALVSALLTDDGRLVVGAVAPAQLYAALGHR